MNKKKRIIGIILVGVYLLVFNPYVIETGREIYHTLYMAKYFLPGADIPLFLSFYHPGQKPEDYLQQLLREPASQNNREELILSLHGCVEMPDIFDLGADKTVELAYEAVSKYPEDPILRWIQVKRRKP